MRSNVGMTVVGRQESAKYKTCYSIQRYTSVMYGETYDGYYLVSKTIQQSSEIVSWILISLVTVEILT